MMFMKSRFDKSKFRKEFNKRRHAEQRELIEKEYYEWLTDRNAPYEEHRCLFKKMDWMMFIRGVENCGDPARIAQSKAYRQQIIDIYEMDILIKKKMCGLA